MIQVRPCDFDSECGQHVEWGLYLDCEKQGCPDKHEEHHDIRPITYPSEKLLERVNGHAVTVVRRVITRGEWTAPIAEEQAEIDARKAQRLAGQRSAAEVGASIQVS